MTLRLGWLEPEPTHLIRALKRAQPLGSAADGLLIPASPAAESLNYRFCLPRNQADLGSCTQFSADGNVIIEQLREGLPIVIPASLAGYYWNRNKDNNAAEDTGATVGGAFEVLAEMGYASEEVYPYRVHEFARRPPPIVDVDAFKRRGEIGVHYHPIMDVTSDALINMIERVLTSGRGVSYGRPVTARFCAELPSGVIELPGPADEIAGGHAEILIGHNHARRYFIVLGSWGADFTEAGLSLPGCYRISYDYIARRASDFWFTNLVPQRKAA